MTNTMTKSIDLKKYIRDIPDFPKKGIIFKDISPLLGNRQAFRETIDLLAEQFKNERIESIIAIEARGFIFGSALAYKLGVGFVPIRKKGKLPYKTKSITYQLEYGTDTLEMHSDAVSPKARVLIVDDVLATGGTVRAVADLLKQHGAVIVGVASLIELTFLKGKDKLKDVPLYSLIQY